MTDQPPSVAPPAPPARLPRRVLDRVFWRFFWTFQLSWNYERMQALGFCWAITPALRWLRGDDRALAESLQRHLSFFNTSPIVGAPLILGTTVAMEEAGSVASAEGVKVAMMGPLAGIGDTLTFALYNSIVFALGASWALRGRVAGPVLVAVLVLVPYLLVRRWQFHLGYRQGRNLAARLAGGALARLNEGATVLGLIVLGGFVPSTVRLVTTATYRQDIVSPATGHAAVQRVAVQAQLDALLPYLLPVALTALVYVVLRRFRLNAIWAIVGVFALGLTLGGLGWCAPTAPS